MITKLLVETAIQCAEECLLYVNCISFNVQYFPSSRSQPYINHLTCELNDEVRLDAMVDFIALDGYKYYERLTMGK